MKKTIIILNLLLCMVIHSTGQSKIVFSDYLIKRTDMILQWTINGVTFNPTHDGVIVYPHEKGMDTIIFQEIGITETKYHLIFDTVIGKIPDNEELMMIVGCCDQGFDLVKNDGKRRKTSSLLDSLLSCSKLDEFDSLYMTLFGIETLKFVILNKPASDTLICVYAGEFTLGQMITIEKDYGWVKPCRSTETDNNISIYILKLNENMNYDILEDEYEFECAKGIDVVAWNLKDWEKDLEIVKQFRLRLFNNERVVIQYDYLTGEIKLIVDNL